MIVRDKREAESRGDGISTCFERNCKNCPSVDSSAKPLLSEDKVDLVMPSTSTENIKCKGLWIRSLLIRFNIAGAMVLLRMNLLLCITFLRWT